MFPVRSVTYVPGLYQRSMVDIRTFQPLDQTHLEEVRLFADEELRRFLEEAGTPRGKYGGYRDQLLTVCLVQGTAQHFADTHPELPVDHEVEVDQSEIDEKGYLVAPDGRVINGVKDIDVLFFFRHNAAVPIPNRTHCMKSVWRDLAQLGPRRLDFMKKGVRPDVLVPGDRNDVVGLVRHYVQETKHGRTYLSKKSVVGLHPKSVFGRPIWTSRRLRRLSRQGHA